LGKFRVQGLPGEVKRNLGAGIAWTLGNVDGKCTRRTTPESREKKGQSALEVPRWIVRKERNHKRFREPGKSSQQKPLEGKGGKEVMNLQRGGRSYANP